MHELAARPMTVLDGNEDAGRFVCPWCGGGFATRAELDRHWADNPECAANRSTNNPTQSKYDRVEPEFGLRLLDREDRDA